METIEALIRRGYRVYKLDFIPSKSLIEVLQNRRGLSVEYHENLKVTLVRNAKSEGRI